MSTLEKLPLISVIDDDGDVRISLGELLESFGYRVALYPDADSFLREMRPERCSCVVSDVQMPGTSGLQLASRLAEADRRPPIILISAHMTEMLESQCRNSGAAYVLAKPLDPLQLETILKDILGKA